MGKIQSIGELFGGFMKPIIEMTLGEINQELCERLGACWHEWKGSAYGLVCKKCQALQSDGDNPDFYSDAGKVQLLREMYDEGEWFSVWDLEDLIIDKDGLLAKMALRWLRKEQV